MLATIETMTKAPDWPQEARRIADSIATAAAAHDSDDSFVSEGYGALKDAGFFKALVPEELGGHGAGIAEICDAIRIIAGSCASTALAFSMHCHLVAVAAWRWRNQNAPTDGLLKRVAAEDLILVSSGGSDWLQGGGTAEKVDGGFKITARKIFSSGSPAGDLLMTSAIYDDPAEGPTVLHFAVPLKSDRVRHLDTWKVLGMRGTGSNDLEIDGFFLPDAAVSGRRPQGKWHPLFHLISMMAFSFVYAAYLGIAESARDKAIAAAGKRPADRLLPLLVGEMENELLVARLAHRQMVEIAETGTPGPEATSAAMACRTLVGSHAIATVEKAMTVAGGGSFYRRSGLERDLRDIQAARFHPLQEKPQLDFTGRVALGLDIDA